MKYKVGDSVRVKSREELQKTIGVVRGMLEFAKNNVTINSVKSDGLPYRIAEDGGKYRWSEDAFEPLTLKEQYFRTGCVVEFKNGGKYIVLRDGDEVALANLEEDSSSQGWGCFGSYNDDLECIDDGLVSGCDIVKVYDRVCRWKEDDLKLIWQREEPKEMTIEEIEKLVGSKVKIVGNQEGKE